jgi:opacity protein-like surface antigen
MPSGLTLHAKARLGVLGFRVAGEIGYSSFSSSGEAQPGVGSAELSHKVLSFKIGPELSLGLPLVPVSPYLGANVALNRFSGEVKFQGITKVPSSTQELRSASRIGFGFTGGVILKLGGLMTLDVSGAYDLLNASGKSWEDAVMSSDQRIDSYTSLNDDKDPLYKAGDDKHFINNSRSINAIQLRATLMMGL